jgi:hypothetical protein
MVVPQGLQTHYVMVGVLLIVVEKRVEVMVAMEVVDRAPGRQFA